MLTTRRNTQPSQNIRTRTLTPLTKLKSLQIAVIKGLRNPALYKKTAIAGSFMHVKSISRMNYKTKRAWLLWYIAGLREILVTLKTLPKFISNYAIIHAVLFLILQKTIVTQMIANKIKSPNKILALVSATATILLAYVPSLVTEVYKVFPEGGVDLASFAIKTLNTGVKFTPQPGSWKDIMVSAMAIVVRPFDQEIANAMRPEKYVDKTLEKISSVLSILVFINFGGPIVFQSVGKIVEFFTPPSVTKTSASASAPLTASDTRSIRDEVERNIHALMPSANAQNIIRNTNQNLALNLPAPQTNDPSFTRFTKFLKSLMEIVRR
jgi:hypothetical protein